MGVKKLLLFGAIILIVAGIVYFWDSGDNKNKDVAGLIIGKNAIYVAEQAPGQSVSVAVVRLEKPGFVVIHEDAAGSPGSILGVSGLLPAGEMENLPPITLRRALIDSETIYAMLHFDDGDGAFDAAKDQPVLDQTGGEPVMMIVEVSL